MELVWPIVYPRPCSALDGLTKETRDLFERSAINYLWRWTGQTFGTVTVTVRPCKVAECRRDRFFGLEPAPPRLRTARGRQVCGCGCSGGRDTVRLPGYVQEVTEVTLAGQTLPPEPDTYRVDNHSLLVRQDGDVWPMCQCLDEPATAQCAWTVTYVRGIPVPEGGQLAAGVLACEMAKAFVGDGTCELPMRVKTVSRQGVELAVLDSMEDLADGHTGIWVVDSWVASVTKPARPGQVFSVDVPRPRMRRQTWPQT